MGGGGPYSQWKLLPLGNGEGELDVHNEIIAAGRWEEETLGPRHRAMGGGTHVYNRTLPPGDGGGLTSTMEIFAIMRWEGGIQRQIQRH